MANENAWAASRAHERAVAAGRWFGGYLAVLGIASAVWIVLLEAVFPEGFSRSLVAGVWAVFVVLSNWWAEQRHLVYPAGATRTLIVACAVWFLAYLLVGGPLVRWQFDTALLPWTFAALVLSLPFFVAAAAIRGRRWPIPGTPSTR